MIENWYFLRQIDRLLSPFSCKFYTILMRIFLSYRFLPTVRQIRLRRLICHHKMGEDKLKCIDERRKMVFLPS